MSEEKHHQHGLFHHHKEHEKPEGTTGYSDTVTGYSDTATGYSDTPTGYSDLTTGYSDQSATDYSETTGYPGDRRRPSEMESGEYGRKEEEFDYKKEEKHHKHLEHVGELGTGAA
ncbi:hypothetical protein J4G24_19725, partial [Clostridioides difficile]|nr:hypothetical protein [Clostridioides difficile]